MRLVVGDISPLAFAAAARAGLPSVAVANFTWDWIYAYYPDFAREAPGVIELIGRAYSEATLALRLPFHGGFESMAAVSDLPFIARRSARDPADTRRALGLDGRRPLVLSSFGGYGAALPVRPPCRLRSRCPGARTGSCQPASSTEDLVAAADVVVSKPGYGIVSECVANRTPLLYTSRGPFAEYDVMVAEMPRMLRCRTWLRKICWRATGRRRSTRCSRQPDPAGAAACRRRRGRRRLGCRALLGSRLPLGHRPARCLFLLAGDERPDPRDVHLLDRDRLQIRLHEKRRQIEIRLEPEIERERRNHALETGRNPVRRCGSDSGSRSARRDGRRGASRARPPPDRERR